MPVISQVRPTDTDHGMAWLRATQLSNAAVGRCHCSRAVAHRPWHRFIHWAAEARSHRVICLVLGIWLLNGFDLTFTILSHEQGMLHEENPVARHILQYGIASIVLFKIGMVLIGSYPLLRYRSVRITELGTYVIFAVYAFLALRWSTCFEVYADAVTGGVDLAEIQAILKGAPQ